jgi:hypothetical protein
MPLPRAVSMCRRSSRGACSTREEIAKVGPRGASLYAGSDRSAHQRPPFKFGGVIALANINGEWPNLIRPVPNLPRGHQLFTLQEAADYILKLPKAEQKLAEWQAATEALIMSYWGIALPGYAITHSATYRTLLPLGLCIFARPCGTVALLTCPSCTGRRRRPWLLQAPLRLRISRCYANVRTDRLHGSYKTTQKYIHLTDEDRMAAAGALG